MNLGTEAGQIIGARQHPAGVDLTPEVSSRDDGLLGRLSQRRAAVLLVDDGLAHDEDPEVLEGGQPPNLRLELL
jgi:hypothetical protein